MFKTIDENNDMQNAMQTETKPSQSHFASRPRHLPPGPENMMLQSGMASAAVAYSALHFLVALIAGTHLVEALIRMLQ